MHEYSRSFLSLLRFDPSGCAVVSRLMAYLLLIAADHLLQSLKTLVFYLDARCSRISVLREKSGLRRSGIQRLVTTISLGVTLHDLSNSSRDWPRTIAVVVERLLLTCAQPGGGSSRAFGSRHNTPAKGLRRFCDVRRGSNARNFHSVSGSDKPLTPSTCPTRQVYIPASIIRDKALQRAATVRSVTFAMPSKRPRGEFAR